MNRNTLKCTTQLMWVTFQDKFTAVNQVSSVWMIQIAEITPLYQINTKALCCMKAWTFASLLKIYAATLKATLSKKQSKVSGIVSSRGVACHTHPVNPDLWGQTPSTAGHWVLGHMVARVWGDAIRDMSYNRRMTGKHGRCVKINLRLHILSNVAPEQSLRVTVAVIYNCAEDIQGLCLSSSMQVILFLIYCNTKKNSSSQISHSPSLSLLIILIPLHDTLSM